MKKLLYVLFVLVFGVGLSIGLSLRPVQVFVLPDQKRPARCTCMPCAPDMWCDKCGHRSRDCPRLQWYFTNSLYRASNRLERVKGHLK